MIELSGVNKFYRTGDVALRALHHVSLRISAGDFVAIMGPSGSGKTTMMNILGCLDVPTDGSYRLDGVEVGALGRNELADIRNRKIGFVFQSFNLIPRTSAVRNVELPLIYAGDKDRRAKATAALERVGLGHRATHAPHELSGGQQQRVAIARAIATDPVLILADEPTGNLDSQSTGEIMTLLGELNDTGRTIVLITHDPEVAHFAKRVITVRDGRVVTDDRKLSGLAQRSDAQAARPKPDSPPNLSTTNGSNGSPEGVPDPVGAHPPARNGSPWRTKGYRKLR